MPPDPNPPPPPEDEQGRITVRPLRRIGVVLTLGGAALLTTRIWALTLPTGSPDEAAERFFRTLIYLPIALVTLVAGLGFLFFWAYRLGPEGIEIRAGPLASVRRIALSRIRGKVGDRNGRTSLTVDRGGADEYVRLPLWHLSHADARHVLAWIDHRLKEPGSRRMPAAHDPTLSRPNRWWWIFAPWRKWD